MKNFFTSINKKNFKIITIFILLFNFELHQMKIIVSPTKSLDFKSKVPTKLYSQPRFLNQSKKLITKLKTLSKNDIGNLMSISEALSQLNYERNQNWETPFTKENAKQALCLKT